MKSNEILYGALHAWKEIEIYFILFLLQVANALAKGVPIVTPTFLTDFFVCQNSKQILPDPKQYTPPLGENTINANDVSLAVKKERQLVLFNKQKKKIFFLFDYKKSVVFFSIVQFS